LFRSYPNGICTIDLVHNDWLCISNFVWLTLGGGKVNHNIMRPHPHKNYFILATARQFLKDKFPKILDVKFCLNWKRGNVAIITGVSGIIYEPLRSGEGTTFRDILCIECRGI